MAVWTPGALAAGLIVGLCSAASSEVAIVFAGADLVASGLSAGSQAALFGVSREPQGLYTRVVSHRQLLHADAAGEARYAFEGGEVPQKSAWAVVDMASGGYAVAAPAAFGVRGSDGLRPTVPAASAVAEPLRIDREAVHVLVVRPGSGAWVLAVRDGSEVDRAAGDGAVEVLPESFRSLGETGEPFSGPAPGDLVVTIDPQRLEMAAARWTGAP